jgi:REP element-mobilizing transposase RayT
MPDHLHLFVGMHPTQSISCFMQVVKGESSEWINTMGFIAGKFQWQEGYGAFSYGKSQIKIVHQYIMDQKRHHQKTSFVSEYKSLLMKFDIPFDEKCIFHSIE